MSGLLMGCAESIAGEAGDVVDSIVRELATSARGDRFGCCMLGYEVKLGRESFCSLQTWA